MVHPASVGALVLIILSGLPGVGKTTLARLLAERLGGVHVRVDTIEQALREVVRVETGAGDVEEMVKRVRGPGTG